MTGTAASRRWVSQGTELVLEATTSWGEKEFGAPTLLPVWTRRHLVAHVASNADALGNLVCWARTGDPIPMYFSPQQREADIESGARQEPRALVTALSDSARRLDEAMDELTDAQWQTVVRTAQGRAVPATEVPWLRAREVLVHAVDLACGVIFADLPADFLETLCTEVAAKRTAAGGGPALTVQRPDRVLEVRGEGAPVALVADLPDLAAYLTGRPHAVTTTTGDPAPLLPAWL